jgi:hypothetical protein
VLDATPGAVFAGAIARDRLAWRIQFARGVVMPTARGPKERSQQAVLRILRPQAAGTDPSPAARDLRAGLLLAILVLTVFLTTASYGVAQNTDTRAAALGAWSVGTRGTVVLPSDWPDEDISWAAEGHDGGTRVNRFPGAILWAAPFYTVFHHVQGRPEPPPHPYLLDFRPAALAAVVATTLAVLVSFSLFLRLVDRRTAFAAALVLAFATSTWSISANALWTHGLTHLFLAVAVLLLASDRPWAAGTSFGLSVLTRPQTASVPLVMGVARAARRRSFGDLVRVGIPSAMGLAAVAAYSWVNFRNPLPTSGYGGYAVRNVSSTPSWRLFQGVAGTLVHPLRGLLVQAPFLLVLLPGLGRAWKVAPHWARSAAVAGLTYQLFQLHLNHFAGGRLFFSYRLPLEMLILSAPLLLLSFTQTVRGSRFRERAFVIGVGIALGFQVVAVTYVSVERIVAPLLEPRILELCADPDFACDAEKLLPRSART